ncbi:MAG: glycerophosphodiester phosphodiesterase family protein [Desulfobacterota bacterium]|nr:glycerophosphodiester phosphodiesterase family protein [Thermodesulfobacteriota bacterium]
MKLRPWAGKFEVVVVAHRGFSAVAPENTLAAFERAIEVGSDMIELDVRLSKEGEVVVIHDETLKRTTTGQGRVIDQTVGELKSVDAGFKFDPSFRGERIPKLSEVLELSRGRIRVNIELKIGDYRPWTILYLTDRVLAEVERLDMLDQVILSSFDPHPLEWALNLRPSIAVAYLYSRPWTHPREVTGGRPFPILHCFKSVLTKENILRAHQEGIGIGVYTLNTEEEMARFVEMGVDAIITDHPDRLIRLLKKEPP